MDHTKNSTESDKVHTRKSSVRGGRWEIGNDRNNTRDPVTSTNKYYRGEIEAFGAVLAMKYDKLELNKYVGVFREKKLTII